MSTATTGTATGTTISSAASSTCTPIWTIPITDAACAVSIADNHTDIMKSCCGSADIVSYENGCSMYCRAVDQTVTDLSTCLTGNGAGYSLVFCNSVGNATATGTALPTETGVSVIASGTSGAGSSASKSGGSATGTGSSSSSTSSSTGNAAAGLRPDSAVSTMGLAIGALLFSATAFGAFAI